MVNEIKQYTFTFDKSEEKTFRSIMSRLDPDEFTVSKEIQLVDPENKHYSELETVMEMEPEAASMFRFGMNTVKIRRTRNEEELAEEAAKKAANTITIKVKV